MPLYFETTPGVVSVFYFIVLDLAVLTLFDIVFSRIAAAFYLRQIQQGKPLNVRSADILGLSTYLIGNYITPVNILVYLTKVVLLIGIVFVDLSIDSKPVRPSYTISLSGLFSFDPSPDAWDVNFYRIVERRFERVRRCRYKDTTTGIITFYSVAFNLTDDAVVTSELSPDHKEVKINDSTLYCLSRNQVSESSEAPTARVIGCSKYASSNCINGTLVYIRDVGLSQDVTDKSETVYLDYGVTRVSYDVRNHDNVASSLFPFYSSPKMTCVRNRFGVQESLRILESCLVIAYFEENNTLIERWEYDRLNETLIRHFPGPIFEGHLNMAVNQTILALQNIIADLNWESYSSIIVADAAVYKRQAIVASKLEQSHLVTTISWAAVIVTIIVSVLAIGARIIVAVVLSGDDRPQLNTIDGLSSIGREENEPTGRSLYTGKVMVLGLTERDGNTQHFGPMRSREVCVKRSARSLIE